MIHIAILGAGAVGQLIAHLLIQNDQLGVKVTILNRANTQASTQTLTMLDKNRTSKIDVPYIASDTHFSADLILVCVKSYQLHDALSSISSHTCPIILFNNGICDYTKLPISLDQLALAVTTNGVYKTSNFSITRGGIGDFYIGAFNLALKSQIQDIILFLPNATFKDNILSYLWQKLAVNSTINPLTAIYQCKNSELIKPQYQNQITEILDELMLVAKIENIECDVNIQYINKIIIQTADNFSSMNRDIYFGRKTEIDAINGYISLLGIKHSIPTPTNDLIVAKIHQLESLVKTC